MSISVTPRPAQKAGPTGPGAGVLMTEYLLPALLASDPQRKMRLALKLAEEVSWIRAAERVISGKIGGDPDLSGSVRWHLEDPDGQTIDDEYPEPAGRVAYELIAHPGAALMSNAAVVTCAEYQGQLWEVTSRHMAVAGQGYWFLDSLDGYGIPAACLYVRPDRLWPICDASGSLIGWSLDPKNVTNLDTGRRLEVDEIIQFPFETPGQGFLACGLVESAMLKAQLSTAIDRHLGNEIGSHGRLSGMFAPKDGAIDNDSVWDQLQRDMRNISEQPDAAKRMQLMRAPMEYTRTQATLQEMAVIDLMSKNRDDLLALWGVPLSQVGGATPAGLNSGDVRKYDEEALWQNAIVTRLVPIKQRIQRRLLDRFTDQIGWAPKLVLDIPQFDDDSPRFDKLAKSMTIALTNDERRDLIGLPPIDEGTLGPTGRPLGQETWLPINIMSVSGPPTAAPDFRPKPVRTPVWAPEAQLAAANVTPMKAHGPAIIDAVLAALRKQWPASELDIVRQGEWTFDPAFPVKKVNAARRPIARNPKIVAGVEAALAIGAPIDPVTLIHTKVLGRKGYEPIDGWHRMAAAIHAGLTTVPAYVGEGDAAWTQKLIAFDDDIPTPPDDAGQDVGKAETPARPVPAHFRPMAALRRAVEARSVPLISTAVGVVLDQQKRDVIRRVRDHWVSIRSQPADRSFWWPTGNDWDSRMANALYPHLATVAASVQSQALDTYGGGGKASPALVADPTVAIRERGAQRVTGINATTRDDIAEAIAAAIEDDGTLDDVIAAIEDMTGFDDYRSELIARTELADAYNTAALTTYGSAGLSFVQASDGIGDAECAARDGQIYSLDDAGTIEDHPNGTLDWIPVIGEGLP